MTIDPIAQFRDIAGSAAPYHITPEEEEFDIPADGIYLDPVAGAKVLAQLTELEGRLYRITVAVEVRLDEVNAELNRALNVDIANAMLENDGQVPASLVSVINLRGQRDRASELLRLHSLWSKVHSTFWHLVRSRLQTFTTILEIRADYTVCVVGSKLDAQ